MHRETLVYEADGLRLQSALFFEQASQPAAGILVFPDMFGMGEHSLERAERLARQGYAALACDLHGNGTPLEDFNEATGVLNALMARPDKTRARARAAFEALSSHDGVDAARVAAIGFCFGGTMALELARSGAGIQAAVGFHSDLSTCAAKTDAKAIKGRVLVCIGADDPMIPAEQRIDFEQEMRNAGVDWQMHLYGKTVHNFTNRRSDTMNMPDAVRYSPFADAHSWALMEQLFAETLALPVRRVG